MPDISPDDTSEEVEVEPVYGDEDFDFEAFYAEYERKLTGESPAEDEDPEDESDDDEYEEEPTGAGEPEEESGAEPVSPATINVNGEEIPVDEYERLAAMHRWMTNNPEEATHFVGYLTGAYDLVPKGGQAPQPEPQAPPDFFADPDAYLDSRLQPLQQQFEQQRLAQSEMLAVEKFGNEAVADAFQAFQQYAQTDPASQIEHRRIMSSPHPFGELVKWRERHKALSEIGSDPVGFRAKLEEEIRQKVLAELQPTQTQAPAQTAPVMPSNFAGARNVGNRSTGPAWSGPTPINDIFARK